MQTLHRGLHLEIHQFRFQNLTLKQPRRKLSASRANRPFPLVTRVIVKLVSLCLEKLSSDNISYFSKEESKRGGLLRPQRPPSNRSSSEMALKPFSKTKKKPNFSTNHLAQASILHMRDNRSDPESIQAMHKSLNMDLRPPEVLSQPSERSGSVSSDNGLEVLV